MWVLLEPQEKLGSAVAAVPSLAGAALPLQWDEALLTMSKGEKAQLEIEPEWGYGKKGQPDAKYPSMALAPQGAWECWGQGAAVWTGTQERFTCYSQQAQDIGTQGVLGTSWG